MNKLNTTENMDLHEFLETMQDILTADIPLNPELTHKEDISLDLDRLFMTCSYCYFSRGI